MIRKVAGRADGVCATFVAPFSLLSLQSNLVGHSTSGMQAPMETVHQRWLVWYHTVGTHRLGVPDVRRCTLVLIHLLVLLLLAYGDIERNPGPCLVCDKRVRDNQDVLFFLRCALIGVIVVGSITSEDTIIEC